MGKLILTMTTSGELKEAAEQAAHEDEFARYYGEYNGRYFHNGVALVFDPSMTMNICGILGEICPELGEPDQTDSMGMQIVWSWNNWRFSDGDNPVACDED